MKQQQAIFIVSYSKISYQIRTKRYRNRPEQAFRDINLKLSPESRGSKSQVIFFPAKSSLNSSNVCLESSQVSSPKSTLYAIWKDRHKD